MRTAFSLLFLSAILLAPLASRGDAEVVLFPNLEGLQPKISDWVDRSGVAAQVQVLDPIPGGRTAQYPPGSHAAVQRRHAIAAIESYFALWSELNRVGEIRRLRRDSFPELAPVFAYYRTRHGIPEFPEVGMVVPRRGSDLPELGDHDGYAVMAGPRLYYVRKSRRLVFVPASVLIEAARAFGLPLLHGVRISRFSRLRSIHEQSVVVHELEHVRQAMSGHSAYAEWNIRDPLPEEFTFRRALGFPRLLSSLRQIRATPGTSRFARVVLDWKDRREVRGWNALWEFHQRLRGYFLSPSELQCQAEQYAYTRFRGATLSTFDFIQALVTPAQLEWVEKIGALEPWVQVIEQGSPALHARLRSSTSSCSLLFLFASP